MKQTYRTIGVHLVIEYYPAERALHQSNAGLTDGEVNRIAGIENKYPNLVRIPIAINKIEGVAYVKNLNFEVNGWESLRPYQIGIRRGIKFAENGTNGMDRVKLRNSQQLFQMLDFGRIDVAVDDRMEGLGVIKKMHLKDIRILEPPLVQLNLYHYLNKKERQLIPKITQTLKAMAATGQFVEIRNTWKHQLLDGRMKTSRVHE